MNLPTELQQAIKLPWTAQLPDWTRLKDARVKRVVVCEITKQSDNPRVCANCSGAGMVYAFLVIGGPHQHAYSGANIASKWLDDAWYYGFTNGYPCPDCSGDSMDHILEHEPAVEGEQGDWSVRDRLSEILRECLPRVGCPR